MSSPTIEKAIKHSLIYTFTLTQPLFFYTTPTVSAQINEKIDNEKEKTVLHYEPLTEQLISTHAVKINDENEKAQMKSLIMKEKEKAFKQMEETITAIYYGEISKEVKEVQKLLSFYGYYTGDIDAIYGPLTKNAILSVEKEGLIQTDEREITIELPSNKQEEPRKEEIKTEKMNDDLIATAKEYIGVPYNWGGTTPNGFDCSGYIQFVYASNDKIIPRTTREIWNFAKRVDEPSIGDLLFFETYQPGPSHLGIYLGNGQFIHAGSSSGVTISNYQADIYWKERFIGAKVID